MRHENPNIIRARELVLAHGWNSTSFQIVNPGIERWFSAAADAVVGYVDSGRVRVVAGAPVCEKERLADIVVEFEADAKKARKHVCYFAAESRLESIFADSSEAPATCEEALATCEEASRTLRTRLLRPSTMRRNALPNVSFFDRGWTSTDRFPPAMASETDAISLR